MPIATGALIGPYEIVGWLGTGGMGEVYRARDPRLGREVAIKLIAETCATDASRVHRFEQEARAAGQLNHPNILAVYDVGTHAGTPYIVSELLEGESLRRRLQGTALATRKAVDYARQIAEGLAAAHDKGIVHRDLKPDNLFITNDGRVKILDFGLAKLTQPADDTARRAGPPIETELGTVLGTAGYMSPEQVRGEIVDHRSDLFSFGIIVYEMVMGCSAFTRTTAAETMAAILKEDVPAPLSTAAPPALERIVSRCLEKAREARFQSARDLAFSLEGLSETAATGALASVQNPSHWFRRGARPWAVAGALAFALALLLTRGAPWHSLTPPTTLRLSAELGADVPLAPLSAQFGDAMSLSPDGAVIAFVAQEGEGGRPQLYVRRLSQLQAVPLSGTDGASVPFFSPDGQWIAFFADTKLKKIAVTGGAAITLSEAPSNRGGTWSEDGTIVFTPHQIDGTRVLRVSSDGGTAEAVTSLADGEAIQLWPQILPAGKAMLYTSSSARGAYNDANLVVQPLPNGARKVVQRGGYHGRYLPSGHLAYIHDGTLFAAPFDLDRLEMTGPPVPALEGVASNAITGGAQFSVSANGTLAYLPGQMLGASTLLRWMGQDGKTTPLKATPANWANVVFSPDGQRLAMEVRDGSSDIWIYEAARDAFTRLTLDPADDRRPVWAPDGRGIAFASTRADKSTPNLYWQRTDGTGDVQRLTSSTLEQQPFSWHPSGRFLSFEQTTAPANVDVMILPLEGDAASGWKPGKPTAFLSSASLELAPMFSPDGRWIAYASYESGRMEVYVRPFPGPGGKWLISTDGGNLPLWSPTTREIFYGADGQIMVAAYTVNGDSFHAEKPRPWSEGRYLTRGQTRMFDLHPDGERFALAPAARTPGRSKQDTVVFVFNFFDELRRIAPATRQ